MMQTLFIFNTNILIWSAAILVAIFLQVLTGTVRLIMMVKGNRFLAVVVGFFEAAIALSIAVTVVANAVKAGINIYMILFYAVGFSMGLLLGMIISGKISKNLFSINIVTKLPGSKIEDSLRDHGFGVTCYNGSGKEGEIKILNVICKKSDLIKLNQIVKKKDSKAMIASHTLEGLSGGFIYDIKSRI